MARKKQIAMPVEKVWLSTQELCRYLDCSSDFIKSLRNEGVIPFSRIRNTFFYEKSKIDNVIKQHAI